MDTPSPPPLPVPDALALTVAIPVGMLKEATNSSSSAIVLQEPSSSTSSLVMTMTGSITKPAPHPFRFVEKGMDLNTAPRNWLRGGAATVESQFTADFSRSTSSVSIAEGVLPTLIAERAPVDIISNSQTVKKLLKAPMSKQPISLAVHRIGDTMLIDEFDAASSNASSDGASSAATANPLNKAIADFGRHARSVIRDQQRLSSTQTTFTLPSPKLKLRKNPKVQKRKNLMSKFLARSLAPPATVGMSSAVVAPGGGSAAAAASQSSSTPSTSPTNTTTAPAVPPSSSLPTASSTSTAAATATAHPSPQHPSTTSTSATATTTARNHMWTFKDLRCLVASDMPIFGDADHPAVSLKLSEAGKPIEILTGMDMWLDNLMCNVPEVVMCYHLNGIVNQYELVKTDDIPTATGFKVDVVQDIAQNITSFLRANATKQGHTYWLYKGEDDDIVRLYDLTVLCGPQDATMSANNAGSSSVPENPFAHPVAMLLFRIAFQMYHGTNPLKRDSQTIRDLLLNVLELVDPGKYPEIAAGAAYLLAGLRPEDLARNSTSNNAFRSDVGTSDRRGDGGGGGGGLGGTGAFHTNTSSSDSTLNGSPSSGDSHDGVNAGGNGSNLADTSGSVGLDPNRIDPRLLPGMIHRHALPADEKMATEVALHQLAQGLHWVAGAGAAHAQSVHEQHWQHRQLVLASLGRASTLYYRRGMFYLEEREPGSCLQNVMLALQCRAGARVMKGAAVDTSADAVSSRYSKEGNSCSSSSAAKGNVAVTSRDLVAATSAPSSLVFKPEEEDDLLASILEMAGDVLSQLRAFCGTNPDALDVAHSSMWQRSRTDAVFMSLVRFLSSRTATATNAAASSSFNSSPADAVTFNPDLWFDHWEAEAAMEVAAAEDGRSSDGHSHGDDATADVGTIPECGSSSSSRLKQAATPAPKLEAEAEVFRRREHGVLPALVASGEVWEGLALPLDIRADPATIFDAAARAYERAERHYLGSKFPTPVSKSNSGSRLQSNSTTPIPPTVILQKLGNARNMFGSLLLDATAAVDTSRGGVSVETANTLWQRAFSVLSQSLSSFESAGDLINTALVSCNLGKLMRVGYRAALMQGRVDALPSDRETQLHDKAIQFYQHAAGALGRRACHPDVWDRVNLELGGAYLAFAILHESIPDGRRQRQFVVELLQKALRHYSSEAKLLGISQVRLASAAYRSAEVHHRLGCICAQQLEISVGKPRGANAKAAVKLATTHFTTALELYNNSAAVASASELSQARLEVTIDLVAMHLTGRIKATLQALRTIAAAASDIRGLYAIAPAPASAPVSVSATTGSDLDDADRSLQQLLGRLERQFSKALLDLIKAATVKEPESWTGTSSMKDARQCYGSLLQHVGGETRDVSVANRASKLAVLVELIPSFI